MTASKYRLADSTYVEPLVNQWPAWSYLMSPLPASLHLLNYQLKVMTSFLNNPEEHIMAANDPELVSGPFMNVPLERVEEVRSLLEETKKVQARNIQLALALRSFADTFYSGPKGDSLEPYYSKIPELMRGYVELIYDYHDRPAIRVFENLLYSSDFYNPKLQSYVMARLTEDNARTFILNTPRFPSSDELQWNLPFASAQIDELFKLDTRPESLERILGAIDLGSNRPDALLPFLTSEPAPKIDCWRGKEIRIRYVGHACVLVEWKGISILTDACVPVRPEREQVARFSFGDLPERIDFLLVTHNHQDHYVFETLLRLRHRIECLVVPKAHGILWGDLSLKLLSLKLGFRDVMELDVLESIALPDGEITGVPFLGEHADLAHAKIAYVVRCGKHRILFAADSDCLDACVYERVSKTIGPVQTTFLSVENVGASLSWVNGPLLPRQPRSEIEQQRRYHACDARRALELLESLGSRRLYLYAMGLEPWTAHLLGLNLKPGSEQWKESERVLERARGRGFLRAERLFGKTCFFLEPTERSVSCVSVPSPTRGRRKGTESMAFWEQQISNSAKLPEVSEQLDHSPLLRGATDVKMPREVLSIIASIWGSEPNVLVALLTAALVCYLKMWNNASEFMPILEVQNSGEGSKRRERSAARLLPLRIDVSDDPTFNNLERRVECVLEAALSHQLDSAQMEHLLPDSVSGSYLTPRIVFVLQAAGTTEPAPPSPKSPGIKFLCSIGSDILRICIQGHDSEGLPEDLAEFLHDLFENRSRPLSGIEEIRRRRRSTAVGDADLEFAL
jgi:L-ascorbate metabolism protein UlaG (beta-lactamase superfamily)